MCRPTRTPIDRTDRRRWRGRGPASIDRPDRTDAVGDQGELEQLGDVAGGDPDGDRGLGRETGNLRLLQTVLSIRGLDVDDLGRIDDDGPQTPKTGGRV
jgi:hypothetical protein